MTNPASARTDTAAGDGHAEQAFALRDLRTRLLQFGPQRMLLVLDLVALSLVAATYLQIGPPELLFHGVFVVLTIDAFVYGRRVCFTRIVAASIALLGYVALPSFEAGIEPLDLTEWPLMFTIAILVAWMADRERTAVRRYAGLYREARDRLVTAEEEERRRLSRDLHDGIGQTLTALTLALDAASSSAPGQRPRQDHIVRARSLATSALEEVRSVAERVRPPRLESRGLGSALHEMALACGVPVALEIDPVVANELAPAHVLEVYRIAQEALGNGVRHAHATEITVRIRRAPHGLRLEIRDDGIGFDPRRVDPRSLGLTGMRERAALLGGQLRISTRPGSGTRVVLLVPVAKPGQLGVAPVPAVEPATLRGGH